MKNKPNPMKYFIAISQMSWGGGTAINTAVEQLKKQLRSKKKTELRLFAFSGKEDLELFKGAHDGTGNEIPETHFDAWVDGMGCVNWVRCQRHDLGMVNI